MELFPALNIGLFNGWLSVVLLGLTEGVFFLTFPKEVVTRLFDRSGWSRKQRAFTIAGKLCAFICLLLLIFTQLKIRYQVFIIGVILIMLGLIGLVKALFDFRNTPMDEPVTKGLYRISRHPQIVMSSLVILGSCIAIGSWSAVAFWSAARIFEHMGILAGEEIGLKRYGDVYRTYMKKVPRYLIFF